MATIDDLTTQTTALLNAVNVQKATLDASVAAAAVQAGLATTNGAAQVALAAVQAAAAAANSTAVTAVNTVATTALAGTTSAAAQAANARDQATAAWAASMAPAEVLPSISKTIHWGAIVKAIIYDTGRDSDGGAWRKRCQDKSWYNEALGGTTWLGQAANELIARGDNLVSYPQEFTNAVWNKNATGTGTAPAITANNALAPDGTTSASTVVFNSGGGTTISDQSTLAFAPVVVNGTLYAHTFQVKGTPGDKLVLRGSAGTAYTGFTLDGTWQTLTVKESAISASGNIEIGIRQATAAGTINSSVTVLIASAKVNQVAALASTYSASPELVSNGGFGNGTTGWTATNASMSVVNGALRATVTANGAAWVDATIPTVANKVYNMTFQLVTPTAGAKGVYLNAGAATNGGELGYNGSGTVGTYTKTFVASGATTHININVVNTAVAGDYFDVDNISLKEVTSVATPYVPYSSLVNNYYQNTTDGKFYALGATYGAQVEVLRGNTREFPEQVAIVADAPAGTLGRVTIYDLTQPGTPMFLVFTSDTSDATTEFLSSGTVITALAAMNGILLVGKTGGGSFNGHTRYANFVSDRMRKYNGFYTSSEAYVGIANRNGNIGFSPTNDLLAVIPAIVGSDGRVNDLAMAVLDNAPVDPSTGLKVPTIAVATAAGFSVIKDDGTVTSLAITGNTIQSVFLHYPYVSFDAGGNSSHFLSGYDLRTLTTHTISTVDATDGQRVWQYKSVGGTGNGTTYFQNRSTGTSPSFVRPRDSYAVCDSTGLTYLKDNPSSPARSMAAFITNAYNTGWMCGDVRGAYLSDVVAETVTGSGELVTNGTFNTDTSGWTAASNGTLTAPGGVMRLTAISNGGQDSAGTSFPTVVGRTYRVQLTIVTPPGNTKNVFLDIGTTAFGQQLGEVGSSVAGVLAMNFVAATTTTYIAVNGSSLFVAGDFYEIDNVSCKLASTDRSVKNNGLILNGSLTKAAVATGANLVGYSGFSAANYLQQPYSANLDFGTGEFDLGVWLNTTGYGPHNLQQNSEDGTGWVAAGTTPPTVTSSVSFLGKTVTQIDFTAAMTAGYPGSRAQRDGRVFPIATGQAYTTAFSITLSRALTGTEKISIYPTGTFALFTQDITSANSAALVGAYGRFSGAVTPTLSGSDYFTVFMNQAISSNLTVYITELQVNRGASLLPYVATPGAAYNGFAPMISRNAATGPSIKLGIDGAGLLTAIAYDGTTTRTVVSPAAVNNGIPTIGGATYRTDGSLALTVNGAEVARTTGAPLLTMNNSAAVLTIGNSFALDAPFPGSLALACISATAPLPDQAAEIYRTELAMMQPGAQCTLDGTSAAVTALAYDDTTDVLQVGTSWGRSGMRGLVRIESAATSVGAITSLSANQGSHITGGATAGRYYQPAMLLRDELRRRDEARKALGKVPTFFDFDTVSFTATTSITAGVSNQLTAVSVTTGTPYVGMGITGAGIPAGTTITNINGATYLMSANATAAASGVVLGQSSFNLPRGYTAKAVYSAGALKRPGSTKDYTTAFDGYIETVNFGTSPGNAVWLSIMAIRSN